MTDQTGKTFTSETCCLPQGIFPLLFIISTVIALKAAQTGLLNVQSIITSSTFPTTCFVFLLQYATTTSCQQFT
jgi:hypothetical protein